MSIRLTNEGFIERAKKIHGERYDYSLVNYVKSQTNVKIICPQHGIFEQRPNNHLNNQGCFKCSNKHVSKKIFIEKVKKIHSNKYDYSLVNYINSNTKIKIICSIHGIFEQKPKNHLSNQGCKKCANDKLRIKKRIDIVEFIKRANIIHNNYYEYSKVKYVDGREKIKIICPIHDEFEQIAKLHLYGSNCPKCVHEKYKLKYTLTTEEFIERANKIHGNFYDYSKVNYVNNLKEIIITCSKHGDFKQKPRDHIQGSGCVKCNESSGERKIRNWLENNKINFETQKTFEICKNINELPFDFYLPNYNLLIEYDGIQHFKPVKYFGGKKRFIGVQKNDKIKNKFAKDNNINLLRISYHEKDIKNFLIENVTNQ